MKKQGLLSLFIFFAFTVIQGQAQPNIQNLTLNGFTQQQAMDMRTAFTTNNNTPATNTTCIWFRLAVINQMVSLMGGEQGPQGQKPDGIRFYYGNVNNQNTVILVSTYYDGIDSTNGQQIHEDYFNHDKSYPLFSNADVNGQPINIGGGDPGAVLYSTCATPCPTDLVCTIPSGRPHYITRKHAQDMVHTLSLFPTTFNTRSEWFPLCLFSNLDPIKYDGVRIYYAKHPSADVLYPNRDALVIELTSLSQGYHMDTFDCTFAQCDSSTLDSQAQKYSLKGKVNLKNKKALIVFMRIDGLDNGEECLNNCNGVTLP